MNRFRYKKPFLLFEVLLAILLVSLCLVPLLERPIQSYMAECRFLKEIEGERVSLLTFSEIKEKLLKNEIPWSQIPLPGKKSKEIPLSSFLLDIPNQNPISIERSFVLRCKKKGEKTTSEGDIYRHLQVEIFFHPKLSQKKRKPYLGDYSYSLIVEKKTPSKA